MKSQLNERLIRDMMFAEAGTAERILQEIAALEGKMKAEDPEIIEKDKEIEELDKELAYLLSKSVSNSNGSKANEISFIYIQCVCKIYKIHFRLC